MSHRETKFDTNGNVISDEITQSIEDHRLKWKLRAQKFYKDECKKEIAFSDFTDLMLGTPTQATLDKLTEIKNKYQPVIDAIDTDEDFDNICNSVTALCG